jgi:hypothetical protein
MSIKIRSVFVLAIALGAACACAGEPPGIPPAGVAPLRADDLRRLTGRAVAEGRVFDDANDGGLTFALRSGGQMSVTSRFFATRPIQGGWRVDAAASLLCTRIESDPEVCAHVYRLPGRADAYYFDADGGSQLANTFQMR